MSALGDPDCKPVRLLCSRRAQHTYEVTFTSEPRARGLNQSRSIADLLHRIQERKNRRLAMQHEMVDNTLPSAMGDAASPEVPRKFVHEQFDESNGHRMPYRPEGGGDALPRSKSMRSTYYEECKSRYRTAQSDESVTAGLGTTSSLMSARNKLIQFLQTEEFFDEYSFIALMALILAHMYRLFQAILVMGFTAHTILGVFIYVWRFMQVWVADILTTYGGPQAAYKCAIFCAELVVIFTSILLFLWAVFIPACGLLAAIASNIFYLIS